MSTHFFISLYSYFIYYHI